MDSDTPRMVQFTISIAQRRTRTHKSLHVQKRPQADAHRPNTHQILPETPNQHRMEPLEPRPQRQRPPFPQAKRDALFG